MPVVPIIIALILVGLLLWVVEQIPLDPTIVRIIRVVVIVAVVVWILSLFTGYTGFGSPGPNLRLR